MSSSLRRGALAAAAIAFSIASLAACGAGNNAQTLEVKPDSAETSVGSLRVQNALVITQPDASSSGPAVISAALFNTGAKAQTLDSVDIAGAGSVKLTPAKGKGKVVVPPNGSIILGGKGNASAALSSPGASVVDGNAQKITFTFSRTGAVTLRALVVPASNYFTKWGPSTIPTPAASGSAKPSASTSSSPSGSATPTDSASASATSSVSPAITS